MDSQQDFRLLSKLMKWRYLDSLDSTRFSPKQYIDYGGSLPQRTEQAEIELIVTMLMGNGIIVPNNQIMDSYGFIHLASSLIETANKYKKAKKEIFIPIKWAKFNYDEGAKVEDAYNLVAMLFNRDGKDGRRFFELSAWQSLANDRLKFADYIQSHKIPRKGFFNSDYDESLAAELFTILQFFSSNANTHIDEAAPTQNERSALFGYISKLSEKDIEEVPFFVKMFESGDSTIINQKRDSILSIIEVFKRFTLKLEETERTNRTIIRKSLVDKPDLFLDNLPVLPNLLRKGICQTIDTIYNFASFLTTKAEQDHQTEPMEKDSVWGVDEAAFALGQWARNKYYQEINKTKSTLDISSAQDTFVGPKITAFTDPEKVSIWDKFFDVQRENNWNTSIIEYMTSLREFEEAKIIYLKNENALFKDRYLSQLESLKANYQLHRKNHIAMVNSLLGKNINYKVVESNEKAYLLFMDKNGNIESRIQIEDFSENSQLNSEENSAKYAGQIADENTTNKGFTSEYGNE